MTEAKCLHVGIDLAQWLEEDLIDVLVAGGGYQQVGFRVGWERLSGSEREGQFQTPLATLHAFNGWADKFLSTPVNGIEDLYFRVRWPGRPAALAARLSRVQGRHR